MKIYSPAKMKNIISSIESRLTLKEQEDIKEILERYNFLFIYARDAKAYIERKENQYAKESDENDKFREKIKNLETRLALKESIINSLKRELKEYKLKQTKE